jgi:hypothetical protein
MSLRHRVIALVAAGLLLCGAAVVFPLKALMIPEWNDYLAVVPNWPDAPAVTLRMCVSDFRVVAPGALSFTVEQRAAYLGNAVPYLGDAVGKQIVIPATQFMLTENNERCSRAN